MNEMLETLIKTGNIQKLKDLIQTGAIVDIVGQDKWNPVKLAALSGHARVLELFCEQCHARDVDGVDENGRDVLHYAVQSGDVQTVQYAVEKLGFEPMRADQNGITAFELSSGDVRLYLERELGFNLADCYRNPIRRGAYPDPSIARVDNDFYMVNSTFVQFPSLPISHSKDLIHWETIGYAITNLEWSGIADLPGGHGYWAPDISYYKGRFWIVATLRRDTPPFRLQMITSARTAQGPYEKPKFLDIDGIDPSLFTDDDGQRYIVVNPGVQIAPIDDDGNLLRKPEMIYYGATKIKTEGPHIIKKDGYYYLFEAEGGTGFGHMETVARSRNLYGRYEKCPFNPILGKAEENAYIQRSGHGKPFQTTKGDWYMVYLCGRKVAGKTVLGRETALDPITWTADGWPMVNNLAGPSALQRKPNMPEHLFKATVHSMDVFDTRNAILCPRNMFSHFASYENGILTLETGDSPDGARQVSMALKRQSEKQFDEQVTLDVSQLMTGDFAGITGYYDENSYFLFGIIRGVEENKVCVIEKIASKKQEVTSFSFKGDKAHLAIQTNGMQRILFYEKIRLVILEDTSYLSDEGLQLGKRFTGATHGLFAIRGDIKGGKAQFEHWEQSLSF